MEKTRWKAKTYFTSLKVMGAVFSVLLLVGLFYSHAGAASAAPDIKLNGMDDLATLASTDTLTATIQMDAGDQMGEPADWWIVAQTPMGWYYYEYPDGWNSGGDDIADLKPAYQGALFNLTDPMAVLRVSGLPVGNYVFYFGIDTTVNGVMDEGSLVYDQVTLQVVEATTPVLSYIFPATTYAGASDQTLTLLGSNFVEGATVNFNGVSREATVVSSTHLTTEITAEELTDAGTYSVSVANGGETSESLNFTLLTVTFGETDIDVPDWTAARPMKSWRRKRSSPTWIRSSIQPRFNAWISPLTPLTGA